MYFSYLTWLIVQRTPTDWPGWSWNAVKRKKLKIEGLWGEFYECVHKKKGTIHVLCRHCRHENYLHPNKNGNNPEAIGDSISSLSRHLLKCREYLTQKSSTQSTMADFIIPSKANKVEDDLRTKVLKLFISGNIAFNQADNPYFQDLLQSIHTKSQIVNRRNLRGKLTKLPSDATEDLFILTLLFFSLAVNWEYSVNRTSRLMVTLLLLPHIQSDAERSL